MKKSSAKTKIKLSRDLKNSITYVRFNNREMRIIRKMANRNDVAVSCVIRKAVEIFCQKYE